MSLPIKCVSKYSSDCLYFYIRKLCIQVSGLEAVATGQVKRMILFLCCVSAVGAFGSLGITNNRYRSQYLPSIYLLVYM